ncbi:MAG TPA: Uma2 family endonuclease [Planctomycetaceae bacterium]
MIRTGTAAHAASAGTEWTVADLAERFGSLPAWRIRTDVAPGTATEEDVERTGPLCELINGVLVEKAVSDYSDNIGALLMMFLSNYVVPRRLGWVHGPQGFFWLGADLRAPDASFTRKEQRPGGLLRRGYSDVAPALAAEVLSPGNTADEMARKRAEFFARGTELFWIVDPIARTIDVYTRPDRPDATLRDGDTLTGDPVLPGFSLPVRDLFDAAELSDEPERA